MSGAPEMAVGHQFTREHELIICFIIINYLICDANAGGKTVTQIVKPHDF